MKKKILRSALFLGAIVLTALVTYILVPRPLQVHYHANMSVYIDGKPWDFSKSIYMEEVSRCNVTTDVRPEDRIHLHDNNGNLVHVHVAASTWGDLFSNLGWTFGITHLDPDDGRILVSGTEGKNLYYFLNGSLEINPWNTAVKSEDRLLVWYGTGTAEEVGKKVNELVPATAHEFNSKADPASCSTNNYGFLSSVAEPIHEWIEHHDGE